MGTFLIGQQRLVHLFAVTNANDLDLVAGGKQAGDGFCQCLNGARRGFLHQNIPADAVLEGKQHQVHRFLQRHDEPGHVRLGDGDGVARLDLVDPQRDDAAPGAHDVSIAGAADFGLFRRNRPGFGDDDLLHHGLGGAHGVDGVGGLVRGQADDGLDPRVNGGGQHVIGSEHVGFHRLHGEKLAGRHLFEGGGMKNVVHAVHGVLHGSQIPDVADEELDLPSRFRHFRLKLMAHVVLFLLVP